MGNNRSRCDWDRPNRTNMAIMVAVAVLGLCGCCCVPCIRGLAQCVIETGMTKVMAVRVEEMTPLREELDSSEDSEGESCAV